MEYLAELFFVHSDFSLSPLLTYDFQDNQLNHKKFYYIYRSGSQIF